MIIIIRTSQMGPGTIGTAVTVQGNGLYLLDPRQWFQDRVASASYSLIPDYLSNPRRHCLVRLNGPAILEMFRSECGADVRLTTCRKWHVLEFLKEYGLSKVHSELWDYEKHGFGLLWPVSRASTGLHQINSLFQNWAAYVPSTLDQDATPTQLQNPDTLVSQQAVVSRKRTRDSSPDAHEDSNRVTKSSRLQSDIEGHLNGFVAVGGPGS
ncbi:hypothetical protein AYO20_05803 [Fonsecaea nubica]|uniref:Uncharacterized protein n=1 Tax=Fonsecaea nubica TaxID=856822 RepID=A0A178D0D7_9EURO|nr:hypothetical protein AYO20_05803 [Fonsecaea nubica]OAL34843.1 hypothetical protein AYO20_05803 [Fonsecaea nubica]